MTQDPRAAAQTPELRRTDPGYGVLAMLMGVLVLHFIDRQIVAILLPDISAELALNDTQAGVLSGIGFALLYSLLGIPIARLADRGNRVAIIAISAVVWSGMTAVSGLAINFLTMLAARMGVAVGEAGGIPPLHSLVADLYSEDRRGRAYAVVQMGGPIGILLAFFVFGALADTFGWRMLFVLTGLFGIGFAALFWIVTPEPRRLGGIGAAPASAPLMETLRELAALKAYRHLVIGTALAGFALYALVTWMPTLLGRSFGLPRDQIGLVLGTTFGGAGLIGVLAFGILADLAHRRSRAAHALVPMAMMALAAPFALAAFLSNALAGLLGLLVLPIVMASGWQAPVIAAVQQVVPPNARALAASLLMLFLNLIGLGFGPLAIGIASDLLSPTFGEQSLQYAMILIVPAFLWSAVHFAIAGRHLAIGRVVDGLKG
jgi:predicted MFS family arabinose efflux permease